MTPWQSVSPQADQLGESPFWHPVEQRLYWVDIASRLIRRSAADGTGAESWTMPQEPGCIAPAKSGGLVIALRDGIYRARQWAGDLEQVEHFSHDPGTTRFNDGKADPLGRFWAGTMYEPRDLPKAALYSVDCRTGANPDGQPRVERKAGDATIANGLAWSPDARTVYWADTAAHVIHAWDWDAPSNAMTRPRVFHQFAGKPEGWEAGKTGSARDETYAGRPDGAAVDSQGNYWCAMYEGARLLKFSPEGVLLATLDVPAQCPTMPCFGGADLKTLYVTSASQKRPASELAALPMSGRVLWTRVEVPGLPVDFFID